MKNIIFICGPDSPEKTEIVELVKEYFSKSEEFVLSQFLRPITVTKESFVVYVGGSTGKNDVAFLDGISVYKKFYDTNIGRRLTAIAGEIIADYMAWCKGSNLPRPVEH